MTIEFTAIGEQVITKKVGKSGKCAIVYLPKAWIGRTVMVVLQETAKLDEAKIADDGSCSVTQVGEKV